MNCFTDTACVQAIMRDINDECDNLMHSGVEATGLIINKEDIEAIARDVSNKRHITAISLKAGARAFRIVNRRNNPFTGTNKSLEVGDFRNTWTKTAAFFVPTDGFETAKEVLDPLANNKFIVIIAHEWEHKNASGIIDNKFEVFGSEEGLKVSSLVQTLYENNDVYSVEMQEQGCSMSGVYFQHSTFTASSLAAQPMEPSGDGWVNPYTGETVAASDFYTLNEEGSQYLCVGFTLDGVAYRWVSIPSARPMPGSPVSCQRVEEVTDDTCKVLSELLTENA